MTQSKKDFLAALRRYPDSPIEIDKLLTDLLTPKEYHDLIERYLICKELAAGATVKQVCDKLGVASATVVRGNRVLKYGAGGMTRFLE